MIESLKGAAALKELTALAQNLEKKLGLPVSVEVLQKLAETKDGYKYLTNIDGKLTEALSKQELETGAKYWADGVKNQSTNTLTLENMLQKPQILQSDIFKSETLIKALGFDKLVEVVKAELSKATLQTTGTTGATETKTTAQQAQPTPQTIKTEEPKPQTIATPPQAAQEEPKANMNAPSVIRLAAAETELSKTTSAAPAATTTATPKTEEPKGQPAKETQPKDTTKTEPQKNIESPQTPKTETATLKDAVLKELKTAVAAVVTQKEEQTKASPKTAENEQIKEKPAQTKSTEKQMAADEIKERLKDFKNITASPHAPSKMELEKIKMGVDIHATAARETKASAAEVRTAEATKSETIEKLMTILAQNFEELPKNMLEDTAKKIADALFGKLPPKDSDEVILKLLEHLEKQLEQKEAKTADKKTVKAGAVAAEEEGQEAKAKAVENETDKEQAASKTENPASKLKAQLLEELAKTNSKQEFQILSNVAMALNKEVFTFVLEDKGVLQFKKKGGNKELNAKTVEFYSAFDTLGPVSGEITHWDGNTSLALNVEFESTYNFLKENLKDLSFFDHKNVSIMHGIKEIVEIKSSFLDTMG